MSNESANRLYRFTYVLVLTIAVTGAFLFLIRDFLLDILLAAIFAGLLRPLFEKSLPAFGGRRALAAVVIVLIVILAAVLPFSAIITVIWSEAVQLGEAAVMWVRSIVDHPDQLLALLPKRVADDEGFRKAFASFTAQTADNVSVLAGFLSRSLSLATLGAVRMLFDLFVISFAVVYFLQYGPALAESIVKRIPVARAEARAIADKTLRVTAATLKSIVIIGAVQGVLVGLGFDVAGIREPWFWGTVAAMASTVPGLGSGLVWAPGAAYLLLTGHPLAGVGLALWGAAVVFFGDSLLRLYIVGRGAAMPGLLVFLSTLGGLTVLGPSGILIGPVLAGILLGVLDLYHSVLQSSGLSNGSDATPREWRATPATRAEQSVSRFASRSVS